MTVAAVVAACFATSCNDWGLIPAPPDPGDATLCGNVNGASGFVLVSHGDTLCTQRQSQIDRQIRLRSRVLLHGIHVTFRDTSGADIRLPNDCALDFLGFSIGDSTVARVTRDAGLRWYFNIQSDQPGNTTLTLSLWQRDAVHFTSQVISIVVVP